MHTYTGNPGDLSDLDDSYYSSDLDDILGAEGGRNLLIGGKGDDSYGVTDTRKLIVELSGEGTNTLYIDFQAVAASCLSATLAAVENMANHSTNSVSMPAMRWPMSSGRAAAETP